MTFATITYNGVEKTLADWGISIALRQASNQAGDNMAFEIMLPTDAPDPFPYGAKIIFRIGRTTAKLNPLNGTLPPSGVTSFQGGNIFFVGYRVDTLRSGSAAMESLNFKFAGPWEFFFDRLVFQKLWWSWNGTSNVADWRSQIVLGMSASPLVGPNSTVPGSNATNLMSIRQQVIEIVQYVIAQTALLTDYGSSPQLQFDTLSSAVDGTNYDLLNYEIGGAIPDGIVCLIPDFLAGFGATGKTSGQTGGSVANMQTVLRAPLDAVNDVTCAEAMRKMLRWIGAIGGPIVWFDYTTRPPTLHVGTRDILPSISLPLGSVSSPANTMAIKIKRRDDLIPTAVALKFRINTSQNGQAFTQVVNDFATPDGEGLGVTGLLQTPAHFIATDGILLPSGTQTAMQAAARTFAAISCTIDMEGAQSVSAAIGCVPVNVGNPSSDGASLTFWTTLFPELAGVANLALYDASGLPPVIKDDTGSTVNVAFYNYRLTKGQIAPWMFGPTGGALAKKCTINVKFKYDQQTTESSNTVVSKKVNWHEKTATVTLCNLPQGTYGINTPGEVVPFGLAGYIFSLEQIPQYEGSFKIQETEITDQCPLGNNLNLTGGLAEWVTMNAVVQSIQYDLTNGRTMLTFGPPGHLGAKDLVERLRTTRGPRWIYYIGSNMINSGTAGLQLGNFTPDQGPSHNNSVDALNVMNTSVSDSQANSADYGAPSNPVYPGATLDAVGTIQYPGGSAPAPNPPVGHWAVGTGGVITSFAHIKGNGELTLQVNGGDGSQIIQLILNNIPDPFDWEDLGAIKFREVQDCVVISGTPTTVYRQALVSDYYTSPLGNV